MKSFPVFRGRNSHTFLKQPAEIELVKDASETTEDDDPEDAIYRSLDWETN